MNTLPLWTCAKNAAWCTAIDLALDQASKLCGGVDLAAYVDVSAANVSEAFFDDDARDHFVQRMLKVGTANEVTDFASLSIEEQAALKLHALHCVAEAAFFELRGESDLESMIDEGLATGDLTESDCDALWSIWELAWTSDFRAF